MSTPVIDLTKEVQDNTQARIFLRPIQHDLEREVVLHSDCLRFSLGRASKTTEKDMNPAKDNGWLESPIISREHARISVDLLGKKLYIKDMKSTHGTFVNGQKLRGDGAARLNDGDRINLGQTIHSGPQVFSAKSFRFGVQWEDRPSSASGIPTPGDSPPDPAAARTFSVPNDTDSEDMQSDVSVILQSRQDFEKSRMHDFSSTCSQLREQDELMSAIVTAKAAQTSTKKPELTTDHRRTGNTSEGKTGMDPQPRYESRDNTDDGVSLDNAPLLILNLQARQSQHDDGDGPVSDNRESRRHLGTPSDPSSEDDDDDYDPLIDEKRILGSFSHDYSESDDDGDSDSDQSELEADDVDQADKEELEEEESDEESIGPDSMLSAASLDSERDLLDVPIALMKPSHGKRRNPEKSMSPVVAEEAETREADLTIGQSLADSLVDMSNSETPAEAKTSQGAISKPKGSESENVASILFSERNASVPKELIPAKTDGKDPMLFTPPSPKNPVTIAKSIDQSGTDTPGQLRWNPFPAQGFEYVHPPPPLQFSTPEDPYRHRQWDEGPSATSSAHPLSQTPLQAAQFNNILNSNPSMCNYADGPFAAPPPATPQRMSFFGNPSPGFLQMHAFGGPLTPYVGGDQLVDVQLGHTPFYSTYERQTDKQEDEDDESKDPVDHLASQRKSTRVQISDIVNNDTTEKSLASRQASEQLQGYLRSTPEQSFIGSLSAHSRKRKASFDSDSEDDSVIAASRDPVVLEAEVESDKDDADELDGSEANDDADETYNEVIFDTMPDAQPRTSMEHSFPGDALTATPAEPKPQPAAPLAKEERGEPAAKKSRTNDGSAVPTATAQIPSARRRYLKTFVTGAVAGAVTVLGAAAALLATVPLDVQEEAMREFS